jgi:hypothetical protein
MRISTDGSDSFGNAPILLDKRRYEASKAHIDMHGNFSGEAVRTNHVYRVACAIGIVGI